MTIGSHAQLACIWEATARKVGNVHPGASFADLEYMTFLLSAAAVGRSFDAAASNTTVGRLVFDAIEATQQLVRTNSNLGIVLLLAPLALARRESLCEGAAGVLAGTTVDDCARVYRAIRLASPGGLGEAEEQDVRDEPTVTLVEAMRLAAERDQIARQYETGYADVFGFGVPTFVDALERFGCVEAAVVELQFRWLARFPDSLIARKCGYARAEAVRGRAEAVVAAGGAGTIAGRAAGAALDRFLRSDGHRLNPGTTADLIAACLFAALRENKVVASAPFRWQAPDWL